ncbi:hypothetical protein PoB_000201500 [Plakobranchus ocellatus]|uniref:Uncharacterized protein n=1 Tax=Plakobranchus ocellatus TaxID=259542 RepID=A0AAV3XY13_9GAST|nr:hypothetical protein PoB_000201500 [Plakobranchus ocellatus]
MNHFDGPSLRKIDENVLIYYTYSAICQSLRPSPHGATASVVCHTLPARTRTPMHARMRALTHARASLDPSFHLALKLLLKLLNTLDEEDGEARARQRQRQRQTDRQAESELGEGDDAESLKFL